MKQKDFIIIGLVVFLGAILSLGLSRLFVSSEKSIQQVEHVQAISAEFKLPDERYFNDKAFDPTQIIKIQDNNNSAPFAGDKKP